MRRKFPSFFWLTKDCLLLLAFSSARQGCGIKIASYSKSRDLKLRMNTSSRPHLRIPRTNSFERRERHPEQNKSGAPFFCKHDWQGQLFKTDQLLKTDHPP